MSDVDHDLRASCALEGARKSQNTINSAKHSIFFFHFVSSLFFVFSFSKFVLNLQNKLCLFTE